MSELQYRFWCKNIILIESYFKNPLGFHALIDALEPPIQAAPINDVDIINKWYDLWLSLKDFCGYDPERYLEPNLADVKNNLNDLRQFFVDNMEKVRKLREGTITE